MLIDTFAIFYRLRILSYYGPQRVPLAGFSQAPVVDSGHWSRVGTRSLVERELAVSAALDVPR